ncbi:MAG TPA: hypothetical protein VMZ50_02830 [Phycisphaerae bacterium]|nr:hypothetical protein [Phycisphaerae bacterium]
MKVTTKERSVLRDLAGRVREIAALEVQERKRQAIIALNGLRSKRPLVYCFPEGAWLECIPPETLQCTDPVLRGWETRLRMAIFTHEVLADDQAIDPVFNVYLDGGFTGWGLETHIEVPDADRRQVYYVHPYASLWLTSHSQLGAYHVDPPLKQRGDLAKLKVPQLQIDHETSDLWLRAAGDILGDILTVRRRGCFWTIIGGVAASAMGLRGMENLWLDLYDDPPWVHALVKFLADAQHVQLDALESGGYLTLNNEAEWIGTGGIGYTDELPAGGFDPARVRLKDIWGGLQAQDLVGISPEMFAEFFFPYMKPILERFGLSHFGCCEPLDGWLSTLMQVGNLRRVSISPWANVGRCAEQLRGDYVFSYKPLPTPITTPRVDDSAMRQTYKESFRATKEHGCHVEIMMKDLHTIQHQPQRLRRWVEIARRAADEVYG